MTRWIRRPSTREERLAALGASLVAAAGVGVVAFYVARMLLARDPIDGRERPELPGGAPPGRTLGGGSEG